MQPPAEIIPQARNLWPIHPDKPTLRVEGITDEGAMAAVRVVNEATGVETKIGISEFRQGIACGKFTKLPQDCEKHAHETQEHALSGQNDTLLILESDGALLGSVEGFVPATDRDFDRATAIPVIENFPEVAALVGRDPVLDATIDEIRAVVEPKRKTRKAAALHSSASNEWFTPAKYVEAAREVMGAIDLDPASCEQANKIVQAGQFYTLGQDGFKEPWGGRVWLNPPYGRDDGESNQARWSKRLIREYEVGNVHEAILLVNATTDRSWFQDLWNYSICFTNHRIAFYGPEGEGSQPTHGNAFVYLGPNPERFREVFEQFGWVTGWQQERDEAEPTPIPQGLDALRAEETAIVDKIKGLNARLEEVYRLRTEEEAREEKRRELEVLEARVAELKAEMGVAA